MINEFIDRIVVHALDKSSGERVQKIEISLKFVGKFDVPLPEPTPEEIAAEEARRKRHEVYLRNYAKKKERIWQGKLAAERATQEQAPPVKEADAGQEPT